MRSRTIFLICFLTTCTLVGGAWYFQFVRNLEPCPLCMFQRVMVIGILLVSLLALVQRPQALGNRVYGSINLLLSLTGAGLAWRHVWLQNQPPEDVPGCGPGFDYIMESFPLGEAIALILKGSGECATISWQYLGLTIPGWTLVFFGVLATLSLVPVFQSNK